MTERMTVGEKVERDGFSVLMLRIAELAQAVGRIPVGEWDYTFRSDPRWRVILNGGKTDAWTPESGLTAKRFHALLVYNGWPAGEVNAAGGIIVAASGVQSEDAAIEAIETEIAHVQQDVITGGKLWARRGSA